MPILVNSGCYNKNTLDWMDGLINKLTSNSSGGWEVQNQVAGIFGVKGGLVL